MEIKENVEEITQELHEYVNLRIESIKLHIVENLSLLFSDILTFVIIFIISILSLIFLCLAFLFLLAPYMGLVLSSILISFLLIIVASVIYINRKTFFGNVMVSRFCKMFFPKDNNLP